MAAPHDLRTAALTGLPDFNIGDRIRLTNVMGVHKIITGTVRHWGATRHDLFLDDVTIERRSGTVSADRTQIHLGGNYYCEVI